MLKFIMLRLHILSYFINILFMIDPYRMVFVNIISSLFLVFSVLFYKYIFPKKPINLLILLILISILPLISILRKGTYESGDLSLHAAFAMPFFESLKEGNIVPVWNQYIMNGFGYPLYLFIYPFPYYLTAILHWLGLSFIDSLKVILAASFVGSGLTMYAFVKEELKNNLSAFTASIFFLFAPYHLVDLHFRVAIGENIAFLLLPLCFLLMKKIFTSNTLFWVITFSLSFALLILSHQAIALISLPLLVLYVLFLAIETKEKRSVFHAFVAFILGILLSAFFWVPVIVEASFTTLLSKSIIYYPDFLNFIFSPWRLGFLYQGPYGELSFILGYLHWFIIIFSILILIKKRRIPKPF